MLTYNFKGVSTKYLNNYLIYHNIIYSIVKLYIRTADAKRGFGNKAT